MNKPKLNLSLRKEGDTFSIEVKFGDAYHAAVAYDDFINRLKNDGGAYLDFIVGGDGDDPNTSTHRITVEKIK